MAYGDGRPLVPFTFTAPQDSSILWGLQGLQGERQKENVTAIARFIVDGVLPVERPAPQQLIRDRCSSSVIAR